MHARERPLVEAIRQRLIKELTAGNHVVLGCGAWRAQRLAADRREAGGHPLVAYLPTDRN